METKVLEFENQLSKLSNEDLVERFNQEVGVQAWVSSRGAFLMALNNQFKIRNIDSSAISTQNSISTAYKVVLEGNRLILLG